MNLRALSAAGLNQIWRKSYGLAHVAELAVDQQLAG
jgi:hypothetical protein